MGSNPAWAICSLLQQETTLFAYNWLNPGYTLLKDLNNLSTFIQIKLKQISTDQFYIHFYICFCFVLLNHWFIWYFFNYSCFHNSQLFPSSLQTYPESSQVFGCIYFKYRHILLSVLSSSAILT